MWSFLSYDIVAQIVDIIRETDGMSFIKELSLVSHSFNQICSRLIFATVDLYDDIPMQRASSKRGFVKLLERRPEVVKYIRKLTYKMESDGSSDGRVQSTPFSSTYPCIDYDDYILSPVLPNFLRTISFLNCLTITATRLMNWNTVNSSLISALLHLMHLPTIYHIDLSSIDSFPLSSLTTSRFVNLHRLDIVSLTLEDDFPDIVVPSEMKIREFHTSDSSLLTTMLLRAETQDGQSVFNFMDLRQLSIDYTRFYEDNWNLPYLLQSAKSLEKLHLSVEFEEGLRGLYDMLSPRARTLKELNLTVCICSVQHVQLGLREELEAMAGNNVLESLSLELLPEADVIQEVIGSVFQGVEEVLVKPGWFALKRVSFKVASCGTDFEDLQSIPDKYLSHLSKLESVDFNFEWRQLTE